MAPPKNSLTKKSLSPFSLHRPPWSFQTNSSSPSPLQIEHGRNHCQEGEASTSARIQEVEKKMDGKINRVEDNIRAILQVVENVPSLSIEGKENIRKALNLPQFLHLAAKLWGRDAEDITDIQLQVEEELVREETDAETITSPTDRMQHGLEHGRVPGRVAEIEADEILATEEEEKETDGNINFEEIEQIQSKFDLPHFFQVAERVLDRETMNSFEDLNRLKSQWNKRPFKSVSQRTPTPFKSLDKRSHPETTEGNSLHKEETGTMVDFKERDEMKGGESSSTVTGRADKRAELIEISIVEDDRSGPSCTTQVGQTSQLAEITGASHLNFENVSFQNSCGGPAHLQLEDLFSSINGPIREDKSAHPNLNKNNKGSYLPFFVAGCDDDDEYSAQPPNLTYEEEIHMSEKRQMVESPHYPSSSDNSAIMHKEESNLDDLDDNDDSYVNSDLQRQKCLFSSCGGPATSKIEDKNPQVADAYDDQLSNLGGQLRLQVEGEEPKILKKEEKAKIGAPTTKHKEKASRGGGKACLQIDDKIQNSSAVSEVEGCLSHVTNYGVGMTNPPLVPFDLNIEGMIQISQKEEIRSHSSFRGGQPYSSDQLCPFVEREATDGGAPMLKIVDDDISSIAQCSNSVDEQLKDEDGRPSLAPTIDPHISNNNGGGTKSNTMKLEGAGTNAEKKSVSIFNPSSSLLKSSTPWIIRQMRRNYSSTIQPRRTVIVDDKEPTHARQTSSETIHVHQPISYSTRQTLHFVAPEKQNGITIVKPTQAIMEAGSQRWKATAIAHFIGKKPYFHKLNSFVHSKWKGIKEVVATEHGFFLFVFKTEAELEAVIENGPQFFNGQPILLQKWQPGMSMEKPHFQQIPVWIKLRNLPLEYWTLDGLSVVASGVGQPLYPDKITSLCARVDFARVCVLIDTAAQLPKHIVVIKPVVEGSMHGTCKVDVEYEWLPPKCSTCSALGHATNACPKISKAMRQTRSTTQVYIPKISTSTKSNEAGNIRDKKKKRVNELKQTNKGAITRPSHRTQSVWLPKKSPGTRPGITPASKPSSTDEPSSNLSPKEEDHQFSSNNPKGTRPTTRPCSQLCSPRVQHSNGDFCNDNPRETRPRTRPCSSRVQIEGRGKEIAIFNPFSVLDLNDADTNADIDADAQMED